jgi:hypothetical protein
LFALLTYIPLSAFVTKAVAICVVFVPDVAVGAIGVLSVMLVKLNLLLSLMLFV